MSAVRRLFVCFLLPLVACGDNNPYKPEPDAPIGPPCSDGVDNDEDGFTDFPADQGCRDAEDESEEPACSDNVDNDGDGKVDFPNDPGCTVPQIDDETDPCPGVGCPQCADGVDNDNNGKTDFPADSPGCASAADDLEFTDDPNACGTGLIIKTLPTNGMDSGSVAGSVSNITSPCGGGGGANGIAYAIHLATNQVIVASTEDPGTNFNTVLDLRTSMCSDPSAEIACHDDISSSVKASSLTAPLKAGTYYLIVQGKTQADSGNYVLDVEFHPGEGTPCTSVDDCGPGLLCRIPAGQTQMVCAGPVCKDGVDDDGDGITDYPQDPGCATPDDTTENDTCSTSQSDPACPACANGVDDDMDGNTDYPADTTCSAASTIGEACPQTEAVIVATGPTTTATTAGAVNDYRPPAGNFNGHACSTTATHTAPDVAIQLDLPATTTLSLRLTPQTGFNTSHILFGDSCAGTPIECYDSPTGMTLSNVAAGRYYLIVDGYSTASGTFTLTTSGTIVNGESCESPLAQSGALTCGVGYACQGMPGSRICAPAQCNDGMDNNGDGKTDFPADPGCTTISDASEDTVCPGAGCPACSDGVDNDSDGQIDYPNDTGCLYASATNEGCPETDAIGSITGPTLSDTLVGATDDHNPSCVTTNFPDKTYTLDIPVNLQSLVIDTEGSAVDTVLSLMSATCTEPSIQCDDDSGVGTGDSLITRGFTAAGTYAVIVDSDSSSLNTFNINIRGTVMPGGSCESALFQSGALVCPTNYTCSGPPGSRTCSTAECLDGTDNNGDGKADYPNDPGCSSSSDPSEDTVCPGSSCPECGDGVDNDSDGKTDYPADPRCASASATHEACFDSDGVPAILMPTTQGTLVGATDDHDPFCVTTNGVDHVYTLTVPNLEELRIDTEGSTVATVLSFLTADCSEPALACDDDSGVGTSDDLIVRSFVSAGTYAIYVDADTTTPNTYRLNVSGTIPPGESCESPLVATGVLSCALGFACDGPVGQRTCVLAECVDGIDNNGDGKTDFPADPGCETFADDSEATVCPGPGCPVCSDGVDNDGDGDTDYPSDASCIAASWSNEACTTSEPIAVITEKVTTGSTIGAINDYLPSCGSTTGHSAGDVVLQLDLPTMATLSLDLAGFSSVHALLDSTCGGTAIACSDPALMTQTNLAAGTYYVVVDGFSTAEGTWTLTATGTVAPGGSCEGSLFQSGAFTCTTGYECAGTMGSRTCQPTVCNDTIDNDGDGKADYPNDPGCESKDDVTETDTCPGTGCPVCADGVDNDSDGTTDYPMDTSCTSASAITEACTQTEPIALVTQPLTTGTTSGLTNDVMPACSTATTKTAPDVALMLELPAMATLDLNVAGFDTVHSLVDATCGGTPIACSDPPNMSRTNVPAGTYYLLIDGWSSGSGSWTLHTSGTVAPGGSCEGALFQSGAFRCTAGHACLGTMGSRMCMPAQCGDSMDNDGDGVMDFPADPGCSSAEDNDEADDCSPTVGPGCPVCSNTTDDDMDNATDYPADNSCVSASFFSEAFCPVDTNHGGNIVWPWTAGSLASAANDFAQPCASGSGNDITYGLQLPVPVASLQIDTLGSTSTNTVVSFWNAACTTLVGCDDNGDPVGSKSVLTLSNVATGDYAIQVDAVGTTSTVNAPFILNVRGTVAPGTACTSELFATGVLVCPAGTTCTGGICQ